MFNSMWRRCTSSWALVTDCQLIDASHSPTLYRTCDVAITYPRHVYFFVLLIFWTLWATDHTIKESANDLFPSVCQHISTFLPQLTIHFSPQWCTTWTGGCEFTTCLQICLIYLMIDERWSLTPVTPLRSLPQSRKKKQLQPFAVSFSLWQSS